MVLLIISFPDTRKERKEGWNYRSVFSFYFFPAYWLAPLVIENLKDEDLLLMCLVMVRASMMMASIMLIAKVVALKMVMGSLTMMSTQVVNSVVPAIAHLSSANPRVPGDSICFPFFLFCFLFLFFRLLQIVLRQVIPCVC